MREFGLTPDQLVCTERRLLVATRKDYRPMSQKELHRQLRAIFEKHGNVGLGFVKKNYHQVMAQLCQQHGSWRAAVKALGLETWLMERERSWSPERVLREIRGRYQHDGSLSLRRGDLDKFGVLPWYATRFFGGWRNAVEAAGITLEEAGVSTEWTKEKIIETIRTKKSSKDFSPSELSKFQHACSRYFGSVKKALKKTGGDWEAFHNRKEWSREIVLERLRGYREQHGEDCSSLIFERDPNLRAQCFRYFGSWRKALKEAGIRPRTIVWTKETIALELRRFLKNGALPTQASFTVSKSAKLYAAAVRLHGSWPNAIEAAGMKHAQLEGPSREAWSGEDIVTAIRGLSKHGLLKDSQVIEKKNPEFFRSVASQFGGWKKALEISCGKAENKEVRPARKEKKFSNLERLAAKRGGHVLSTREDLRSSLTVQLFCERGHLWNGNLYHTLRGTWCSKCTIEDKLRASFQEIQETIQRLGGTSSLCFEDYRGVAMRISVRCKNDHSWKTTGNAIIRNVWCQKCYFEDRRIPLDDVKLAAEKCGGKCLSPKYLGIDKKLNFQCKEGHVFQSAPSQIFRKFHCKECRESETLKKSYALLKKLAEDKGGRLLSKDFFGRYKFHSFVCSKGHRWEVQAAGVLNGQWCAACYHESRNLGLDELQNLARKRNGQCLSKKYEGARAKHLWRCQSGHQFSLSPENLRGGSWCPICAPSLTSRRTIEQMQAMAKERGGRILSKEYLGGHTHHLWECATGHQWKSKPNTIQQGSWCPECARERRRVVARPEAKQSLLASR